jgi:hypothetical protein
MGAWFVLSAIEQVAIAKGRGPVAVEKQNGAFFRTVGIG